MYYFKLIMTLQAFCILYLINVFAFLDELTHSSVLPVSHFSFYDSYAPSLSLSVICFLLICLWLNSAGLRQH